MALNSVHTVNPCVPHDSDNTGYFPTHHQIVGLCNYSAVFSVMYKLNSSILQYLYKLPVQSVQDINPFPLPAQINY